jgi:O-antigen ligase
LLYCVLQHFQLDEFFKGLGGNQDELVGTIGNTAHLAGYLALVSPLFFNKRGILPLILLWIVLLLAGSASGLITAIAVLITYLFLKRRFLWGWIVSSLVSIGGIGLLLTKSNFLNSSGRLEIWKASFEIFRQKAITGFGLGSFSLNNFKIEGISSIWRHAHNEYFQVAFELGLIGLILLFRIIFNAIKDAWLIRNNDNGIILFTMLIGFIVLSLLTFTMHLWQISVLGMFIYSAIYVIKNNSGTQALGV